MIYRLRIRKRVHPSRSCGADPSRRTEGDRVPCCPPASELALSDCEASNRWTFAAAMNTRFGRLRPHSCSILAASAEALLLWRDFSICLSPRLNPHKTFTFQSSKDRKLSTDHSNLK